MPKPLLVDSRFDFRGGRNTAISSDLLNPNELVDCTNTRLNESYGGFSRRLGSKRIHPNTFPAGVMGVYQWDIPSGKQTVVISNGDLYYRNGHDFGAPFTLVASTGVARSTAAQGAAAGWVNTLSSLNGPVGTNTTDVAGSRPVCTVGDPAAGNNLDAADDLYYISFDVKADGTGMSGTYAAIDAKVTIEVSTGGGPFSDLSGPYTATASIGTQQTNHYDAVVTVSGAPAAVFQFRLKLQLIVQGLASGNGVATCDIVGSGNYPVTWTTGAARFSTTDPAMFAPFRASSAGAPLKLFIASGGHYFSWDGAGTLTQLDPTNSAPGATNIIPYHTRMFAMTASPAGVASEFPKTIYWSVLGDATDFRTGDKTKGGSAVTDFLTGQRLVALEVIGSSLLMGTNDSVMRFTGHSSDDIVIAQDTEGINAEVGPVGILALKRFENVAAMLTDRGAYVVTETYAEPSGEQLNPDWAALDSANLDKASIEYNRGTKDLLFAVPGATDGGYPKTIFAQAVRLQAWQGPWLYPFSISYLCKYFDSNGFPSILAGSTDGYVRQLGIGTVDDGLYNGTGGTVPTMTVELPVIHFGTPGQKKALKRLTVQADIPTGGMLKFKFSFDGDAFVTYVIPSQGSGMKTYPVDLDGQGFRLRAQFVNDSNYNIIVNGYTLEAWNLIRTS